MTVGLFTNGEPGELFVTMAKEGSTVGGLMDTVGTLVSISLQYGVPLETLVRKFQHQRFEPSGWTSNPSIKQAASIIDYVFRWMGQQFCQVEAKEPSTAKPEVFVQPQRAAAMAANFERIYGGSESPAYSQQGAPLCPNCGHVTVRNGACFKCINCGESLGCS